MANQKSLKKSIKSNKRKKLNFKNLDLKKNWKKLSFSGALALLLFSSVGFGAYTYISQKNLEAQAAGWTWIGPVNVNGSLRGCKTYVNSAYGPLYLVRMQVYSGQGTATASSVVYRNGQFISSSNSGFISQYRYGYTSSYISIVLNDKAAIDVRGSISGRTAIDIYGNGAGVTLTSC